MALVIGVAGGSGSGKTTITRAIADAIGADQGTVIEQDSYYLDQGEVPLEVRAKTNYDHPDSLETELMVRQVHELLGGATIEVPIYDFTVHTRKAETMTVTPHPVVILEGILILQEPALRDLMDLKIFVDTDDDIRLIRRLDRDINERGRTFESIIGQYLETVRPMHLRFVESSKRHADIIIPEGHNPAAVSAVTSMIRDVLRER